MWLTQHFAPHTVFFIRTTSNLFSSGYDRGNLLYVPFCRRKYPSSNMLDMRDSKSSLRAWEHTQIANRTIVMKILSIALVELEIFFFKGKISYRLEEVAHQRPGVILRSGKAATVFMLFIVSRALEKRIRKSGTVFYRGDFRRRFWVFDGDSEAENINSEFVRGCHDG